MLMRNLADGISRVLHRLGPSQALRTPPSVPALPIIRRRLVRHGHYVQCRCILGANSILHTLDEEAECLRRIKATVGTPALNAMVS
jgi:hypothetical protein